MTHTIRPVTPDDYAALAEVQRRAVEQCLRPLYEEAAIETWLASLDAAKFLRVVATGEEIMAAVVDGRVVGFVSLSVEMSLLGMWYVDPEFIGRGIGASLLGSAEARLRELGCREATAEASLFALPHFSALGWVAIEEYDKPAFGGTFRVTRMSKAL